MATGHGALLALSGGVGGAKLALGLAQVLPAQQLNIVVNTGDDFEHLGLTICPDIDTLLYTLSGRGNKSLGWGLEGESWNAMEALESLGGDTWFRLGDKDLATHLWRTELLSRGVQLQQVTTELAQSMGIASNIFPMTNDSVRTTVICDEGELPFQHYFVRRQCEPRVQGFRFDGIDTATPNPGVEQLIMDNRLDAIVVCPSNPFVSIDPILQVPGQWQAFAQCSAPVIAVSPIVAGMAIKGPAAKMMRELGMPATAQAVAAYYNDLIDLFVFDRQDQQDIAGEERPHLCVNTLMVTRSDRLRLAQVILDYVVEFSKR